MKLNSSLCVKYIILHILLLSIIILFFVREQKSYIYLENFKNRPSSKNINDTYTKVPIPFWLNLDIQDNLGYGLLHYAVAKEDFLFIKDLLSKGANVNIRNQSLQTPLHLSALYEQQNILKLLLVYSANPNIKDTLGKTPIVYAAERGAFLSLKILHQKGADLFIRDSLYETLLDKAIKYEYRDIVLYLLPYHVMAKNYPLSVILFLDYWKNTYRSFFNFNPIYENGIVEYFLGIFNLTTFKREEDIAIKKYLYERRARRDKNYPFPLLEIYT